MTEKNAEFPKMLQWRKMVLHPHDSKQFWSQKFYEYYKTKFKICLQCNPKRICEIGVRWGYSAFSFLWANPAAEYTGLDIIAGTHGGVNNTDTFDYVEQKLKQYFPQAKVRLIHVNTQQLEFIDGPYDFIHIDGDHSIKGAYHDIRLAFSSIEKGGHLLIDDYDYIAGVHNAAERFIHQYDSVIHAQLFDSLRGDLLITRKE